MLVKPAPGLKFRDPATKRVVPEDGIEVPDGHPMWTRMIAHGDCVLVSADTPPAPPAPPPKAPAPPQAADSKSNGGEV